MEYLNIIEENFTKSDYVAYLRGSILMWLLEDKPFDTTEFKLYADKLVEVLEKQSTDTMGTMDTGCSCLQTQTPEPTVDPDEPKVQPKHEFKLGDHVIVSKGSIDERTGVIVRLPMDGVDCRSSYVVDLDDKDLGWIATVAIDGVDCNNAWVTSASNMELIVDTLKKNTWYHTTDFTVDELSKLLPSGTKLQVEKQVLYDGIREIPPKETKSCVVKGITTSAFGEQTLIEGVNDGFLREWFKIVED